MEKRELRELLRKVAEGAVSLDEAQRVLSQAPYEDLGFAKVDHARGLRQGVGEIIYGAGKSADQIIAISQSLMHAGQTSVLITRIDANKAHQVAAAIPQFRYFEEARVGMIGVDDSVGTQCSEASAPIVVACAGTSDLAVAEEAALTAEFLGEPVRRLYDVGVAGIHRLLSHASDLASARVVIAVAGMEGALASVIGGLVSCPVIAVPTSVGYGASFNGVAALLAMLNSCASGVSVVNIDNGFGAGYQAHLICQVAQSDTYGVSN